MTALASDKFVAVTRKHPCEICGKGDWCRRSASGARECHRINQESAGAFQRIAVTPAGFAVYREPHDATTGGNGRAFHRHNGKPLIHGHRTFEAAAESAARRCKGTVETIHKYTDDWYR